MRRVPPRAGGDAGFTLLEVLAATAVLGLILAMLTHGMQFGLVASRLAADGQAGSGQAADLLAADEAVRHLIQRADPGVYPDPAPLRGTADALFLTTELPSGGAGPAVRADAELRASAGRLVLRWRRHRHAEAPGPSPPWEEAALATGVERVVFSYRGRTAADWSPAWTGERLPSLVEVRVVFAEGSGLRWPPMIVATRREPIEE